MAVKLSVTVSDGLSPPDEAALTLDTSTSFSVYTISGITRPDSLRPTVTMQSPIFLPSQQDWFSTGDDLSMYLEIVKSCTFGLPEVRSLLLTSLVICIATAWLYDRHSILSAKPVSRHSPSTPGKSKIMTSTLLSFKSRFGRGPGSGRGRAYQVSPVRASGGPRRRQLGHQPHRCRQLLELEVRPQEHGGLVHARLGRIVGDVDARLAQRVLGLQRLRGVVVDQHVVGDPVVQIGRHLVARREAADLVAHLDLDVVGEARRGHHARQLR